MTSIEKKHPHVARTNSRRKQVLDAASSCFSRRGFHAASMADISKAAGMSAGHIYNYFASKEAIIIAFVQQNIERVNMLLLDLGQQEDPLQALIDCNYNQVMECLDPMVWALPLEIFSEASRNPVIAGLLQQSDRQSRSQFLTILKTARIARGLPADERMLDGRINALIAMYEGIAVRAVHDPDVDGEALANGMRVALTALLLE
jgi:AcrR family transcriptional regulator